MKRMSAFVSLLAAVSLLLLAACRDASGPVRLAILQVQGTVTSTATGAPIEGVGVVLFWEFAGFFGGGHATRWGWTDVDGRYAVTRDQVFDCTPGGVNLGVSVPDGYRVPIGADVPAVACTEEVQIIDLQLEPAP